MNQRRRRRVDELFHGWKLWLRKSSRNFPNRSSAHISRALGKEIFDLNYENAELKENVFASVFFVMTGFAIEINFEGVWKEIFRRSSWKEKLFWKTIFDFENHEEISSSVQSTFRCNPRFDVAFEFVVSLSLKSCWACDFLAVSIDPAMCKTWRSLAFFYAFNIFWASDFLFFAWNSHFCVLFFAFFSSFYSRLSVGVFEEQWTWWESHEAE